MKTRALTASPSRQRGIASLVIVALLFFVLSLVAAYTNRNLIFEQRTATNQYRSSMALDAAEAGAEWALALLNGGRIDTACEPTTDAGNSTFRDRYLSIDPDTGIVTLTAAGADMRPACVLDEGVWRCTCPIDEAEDPEAAGGTGIAPAFRLRFLEAPLDSEGKSVPGAVRLQVNGCTRLDNACLGFPSAGVAGEGRVALNLILALRGALAAPPAAAITVRGTLDVGASSLGAFNTNAELGGLAIQAGGSITGTALRLGGAPGMPSDAAASQSLAADDPGLAALADVDGHTAGDRMFFNVFATRPQTWRDQPSVVRLDCDGTCSADMVRDALESRPGHAIWADGDVDLDGGGDIGTADRPLMLVATGSIRVEGLTVRGLLYSRSDSWDSSGAGTVFGGAVAENNFAGNASFTVSHDAAVLNRLRWQTGSFVRAPGGWRDF